jgi:hypothetical protein
VVQLAIVFYVLRYVVKCGAVSYSVLCFALCGVV